MSEQLSYLTQGLVDEVGLKHAYKYFKMVHEAEMKRGIADSQVIEFSEQQLELLRQMICSQG